MIRSRIADTAPVSLQSPDRRRLIKMLVASGAGFSLGGWANDADALGPYSSVGDGGMPDLHATPAPATFIRIGADDSVTVIVKHLESGQGIFTGLPTVVAEEMDAAWSQIRVESAPANKALYSNLMMGLQATGASSSIPNAYMQYRLAGAAARAMLVQAAAALWKVDSSTISIDEGVLRDVCGHRATFGQLATLASGQTVPASPILKDVTQFRLIGKPRLPRTDTVAKCNGSAIYTQDFSLPGMLTAVVAHPPRFGARVGSVDDHASLSTPGVRYVVPLPTAVAIIADQFWAAKTARERLIVHWDEMAAMTQSSAQIVDDYRQRCLKPGMLARADGDVDHAMAEAVQVLHAEYQFPYLAHATMEPLNCVIQLDTDRCQLWYGAQAQTPDQGAISEITGLAPEKIFITALFAGGSFGRRGNVSAAQDFVGEAARIARALADRGVLGVPIKLAWTREDDMRGGYYRPLFFHAVDVGIDADGRPLAWKQRIAGQSIAAGTVTESFNLKQGVDHYSVEGAATMPYAVPNLRVELHTTRNEVPVLWWRGVGFSHATYVTETMLDRVAALSGRDPLAFRRGLLTNYTKHLATLELLERVSGWRQPLSRGAAGTRRGRGVAIQQSYGTIVAQVAEVTVRADGSFAVDRIVCAVHCGLVINPDIVRSQMEGGIGWSLSAALHGQITVEAGSVMQSNFHDFQVLRIHEMPTVDVHIVPSTDAPSGVGECAVAPAAPAVANAIAAATGQWLTHLPFKLSDFNG